MSEEEKEAIKYMKEFQKDLYGASSKNLMASYLDTIFNLIEQQQKETEDLKKDREKVIEIITDTEDNLDKMFIKLIELFKIPKGKVKTNCISKDKIRAKIKEIDEDELLQKIDFGQIALAIKVLYELLEE